MDITKIKVGENTYNIKDQTARETASGAVTTADTALTTAGEAQTTATNTDTKLTNSKVIGTYTPDTETLEISLQIGSV